MTLPTAQFETLDLGSTITLKEKAKITAGVVVALVIVGWMVVLFHRIPVGPMKPNDSREPVDYGSSSVSQYK